MFQQRLKTARKTKHFTQEQLAQRINTTKATISNYENGYSTPSNDTLVALAKTLECSVDYLLGIEEKFNVFIEYPALEKWYRALPNSKEDLLKLYKMWHIFKEDQK